MSPLANQSLAETGAQAAGMLLGVRCVLNTPLHTKGQVLTKTTMTRNTSSAVVVPCCAELQRQLVLGQLQAGV